MKKILLLALMSGLIAAHAGSATAGKATVVAGLTKSGKNADVTLAEKLKKKISADFKECALTDVLDFLHKTSDVNFIVTGKPEATITLCVKDLPLEDAVRYLGALTGLEVAVEKDAVVFRAKPADAAQAGASAGSYKMETSVESAQAPHQYMVAIKIQQSPDGKQWDVLSAPKITVKAGAEGKIEVKDEKTGDGIECTVLVNEVAAGTVEMNVVCKFREHGKQQWQNELKTRIKLP